MSYTIFYLDNGTCNDINKFSFIVKGSDQLIDTIIEIDKRNYEFSSFCRISKKALKKQFNITSKCTKFERIL